MRVEDRLRLNLRHDPWETPTRPETWLVPIDAEADAASVAHAEMTHPCEASFIDVESPRYVWLASSLAGIERQTRSGSRLHLR